MDLHHRLIYMEAYSHCGVWGWIIQPLNRNIEDPDTERGASNADRSRRRGNVTFL